MRIEIYLSIICLSICYLSFSLSIYFYIVPILFLENLDLCKRIHTHTHTYAFVYIYVCTFFYNLCFYLPISYLSNWTKMARLAV